MISAMIEESFKLNSMAPVKMAESYISTSLHDAVKLRTSKCGLGAIAPQTIPQFFRECCQKFGHLPALVYEENISQPTEGVFGEKSMWKTITYHEYEKMVQQTSLLLLHVGLQPRSSVGILAFNCPEWFYIEMATLRAGGVVAGIYTSNSAEAVFHVLDTSEATICVVDDKLQMEKVRAIKSRLPRLGAVIQINGPFDDFVGVEEGFYRWEDLIQMEYGLHLCHELKIREEEVVANECAILIYTVSEEL